MTDLQAKIAAMYQGDLQEILSGICDERQILVVNAIITGTRQKIRDTAFVERLHQLTADSETKLLNVPISFFAIAALDILGIKRYTGDDEYIKKLIDSKLQF